MLRGKSASSCRTCDDPIRTLPTLQPQVLDAARRLSRLVLSRVPDGIRGDRRRGRGVRATVAAAGAGGTKAGEKIQQRQAVLRKRHMAECCGQTVKTPFCPLCGARTFSAADPSALLIYLRGQRAKTHAWIVRCERGNGCLNPIESDRRKAKHQETLFKWDAWIGWVEKQIGKECIQRKQSDRFRQV